MKRLLGFVAASALAALSALPGAALADSIVFTDIEGPGLHKCLSTSASTPCHDGTTVSPSPTFTLDVGSEFDPISLITAAELTLTIADDGGPGDGSEKLDLVVDGVTVQHNANANHDVVITFSDFTSLGDGKLIVSLSATVGDFFLEGARLTIVDDPALPGATVPAPAALMLLGAGLAGLAWRRRAPR